MTFLQEFVTSLEQNATQSQLLDIVARHHAKGMSLHQLYDDLHSIWMRFGFDTNPNDSQLRDSLEMMLEKTWYELPDFAEKMTKLFRIDAVVFNQQGMSLLPGILVEQTMSPKIAIIRQGTKLGIRLPGGKIVYSEVVDFSANLADSALVTGEIADARIVLVIPVTESSRLIGPGCEVWA